MATEDIKVETSISSIETIMADTEIKIRLNRWQVIEGLSYPLGVTDLEKDYMVKAYNFSIYSKHATQITLLLYKELQDGDVELCKEIKLNPLINKSERIWHCIVPKKDIYELESKFYAYRIAGPNASGKHDGSHAFDPEKRLLDPFARSVYFPKNFNRAAACQFGSNEGKNPLGVIPQYIDEFDWENIKKPVINPSDLIIYEFHVRQFTKNENQNVKPEHPGTYEGVIDKIPYLKELGVTAIELMPVHQYDPQEYSEQNGYHWGYMTLNFFSPHNGYASDKSINGTITEFKRMVRELHKAGIAVILDVVYNHTTEGNHQGPHYSFKGIDNSTYYMTEDKREHDESSSPFSYIDFSGTGNTLHTANAHVGNLILQSLRFWNNEMQVDGFRFDLGTIFMRASDGTININAPIFSEITNDPALQGVMLIAEPWGSDYFPEQYGHGYYFGKYFSGLSWKQWNDRYRTEMKKFVKGDGGLIGNVMRRIYGSDDAFPDDLFHANHSYQSINYLASHDGFTMYDCTAYTNDDQQAWDSGGDEELRRRQVKNMITLLMLSNGTPMFRAGDEFCQTQNGNSNPYKDDDENVWINWARKTTYTDVFDFFKKIIAFRKSHPSIGRSRFWREDVLWFGAKGSYDLNPETRTLAYFLNGKNNGLLLNADDIYVMINMHWGAVEFEFQKSGNWNRIVNTGLQPPHEIIDKGNEVISDTSYLLGGRSIAVFVK